MSPEEQDWIIRTVYGEAANQDPVGQQAVANVIRNRMLATGRSARDVVLAPAQFEPWTRRADELQSLTPQDPRYQSVAQNLGPFFAGQAQDPTGGATHFFAPRAQAALGRPEPAWAAGRMGMDIGDHRFYRLPVAAAQAGAPSPLANRSLNAYVQQQQEARANPANYVDLTNQSATRNLPITDALRERINNAILTAYGPGYRAQVYSGGQPAAGSGLPRVGSTRHDLGHAADIYVVDPQGNRLTGDALGPLAQYWLGNRRGGVGLEMRGGGIHLDTHTNRSPFWTYGQLTPGQQRAVQEGMRLAGLQPPAMPQPQQQPQMQHRAPVGVGDVMARDVMARGTPQQQAPANPMMPDLGPDPVLDPALFAPSGGDGGLASMFSGFMRRQQAQPQQVQQPRQPQTPPIAAILAQMPGSDAFIDPSMMTTAGVPGLDPFGVEPDNAVRTRLFG